MITVVAIVLAVAAEALVAYAAAEIFAVGFEPPTAVHAVTFVVTSVVAFGLPRIVSILRLPPAQAAIVGAAAVWLFVYAPVHVQFAGNFAIWDLRWIFDFIRAPGETLDGAGAPVTGAILLLVLWVRSTWRSNADIELDALPRSMGIPFALGTAILVLAASTDRTGEVARAVLGVYAVGLLTLAFSQLALSGATYGDVRAGGTTAVMLAGTAIATFVAVLVFGPVYSVAVNLLEPVVTGPLASVVEFLLYVILAPPIWLLSHLFDWLIGDISLPEGSEPVPIEEPGESGEEPEEDETTTSDLLWLGSRILLVLGGLGAIAAVVVLLSRLRRRALNQGVARPESESAGGFGGDLLGSLRSLFPRRSARAGEHGPATRLYLEVLEAAHTRGVDRGDARTPREFAPRLEETFHDPVTDDITAAFMEERYAGRSADAAAAEALRRRWQDHASP